MLARFDGEDGLQVFVTSYARCGLNLQAPEHCRDPFLLEPSACSSRGPCKVLSSVLLAARNHVSEGARELLYC